MTLDELFALVKEIRKVASGEINVEVYSDQIKDYVPLDSIEFTPADEYGASQARVLLT